METESVHENSKLIHILNEDDQSVSVDGRRSTGDTVQCVCRGRSEEASTYRSFSPPKTPASTLGPSHPPVQGVKGFFGVKRPPPDADHVHLVPMLRVTEALHPLPAIYLHDVYRNNLAV